MSNMSNLDVILTAHKLSDAQKNAVVELLSPESGYITAKPNTLKSLERKGLVTSYAGGGWQLADEFRAELNLKTGTAESLESLLQGDPWKLGDATMEDEAELEPSDLVAAPFAGWELKVMATNADQFDGKILGIIKDYIATVDGWKGIEVWDSLSLEEIKEDIETATPVNRKARRTHFRTLRNAFRRLNNKQASDSRKSLKITGKVGV